MATSRLKRKLERDPSSLTSGEFGNLSESFVTVGTALPSLADPKASKDTNEFKPVWQQEVTDDQGRRRFHGAFTGGFSAGYYNSVGSKEGWTPSTFKSSRSNRANQGQRSVADAARDFMDEEDLAELASSRTLETSSAYSSRAAPPPTAPKQAAEYDPLLGLFGSSSAGPSTAAAASSAFDASLADLIAPSSSRVGLSLMRKMGWRDGQGVGPRVTLAGRKKQAKELGIALPADEEGEGEEGAGGGEASKHLYAPLDRPLTLVKGTSTSVDRGWGLGYEPGMTLDESLGTGGGGGRRGLRMEVDEEDPYAGGAGLGALGERERRALGVYGDEEDEDDLERMKRRGDRRMQQSSAKRTATTATPQAFVDGTRVLPGFTLAAEPIASTSTSHLPPPPPAGWRPNPSRLWKENEPPVGSTVGEGKGKGRQLQADERGSLLGETLPPPPPPMPKSVFDYLSAKSRERLASVTGSPSSLPPPAPPGLTGTNDVPLGGPSRFGSSSSSSSSAVAAAPPAQPEPANDVPLFVPPLDKPTALAALRGFQPYSTASTSPDAVKHARYTLYLQYQASSSPSTTSSPFGPRTLPSGKTQTVEELNRELSEYQQAARVFKPVGGMLGSRFQTSQTGSLDVPQVEPGLWQPKPKAASSSLIDTYGDASSTPAAPVRPPSPKLTPAQQAARAGNFGPGTTRTVSVFRPAKLVCKRFGVRDPFDAAGAGSGSGADESGVGGRFGEATSTGWGTGNAAPDAAAGGGARGAVGARAMEEMRNSAGFQRFQKLAEEEDRLADGTAAEVAKGAFSAPGASADGGLGGEARKKPAARPTLETVGLGDDERQGDEIVEEKKAPADIFAAIFADSDDSDDDDEEEEDGEAAKAEAATVLSGDPPPPSSANSAAVEPPKPAEEPAVPLSLDTLSSFRPSFAASSSRTTDPAEPVSTLPSARSSTSTKEKKSSSSRSKKGSSSKRKAVALSFDLEDGGAEDDSRERDREREKERREKKKARREKESSSSSKREKEREEKRPSSRAASIAEEDEWAEAAPEVHPSILQAMSGKAGKEEEAGGRKGRMRAAELF
ncbi:hypothetical protein JCM8097_004426 [Rhodosporidiobolus ruineniae]